MPIFHNVDKKFIHNLFNFMQVKEYNMNDIIYSENDESEYVYIIKKGKIEI